MKKHFLSRLALRTVLAFSLLSTPILIHSQESPSNQTPGGWTASPEVFALLKQAEDLVPEIKQPLAQVEMMREVIATQIQLKDKSTIKPAIQKYLALLPQLEPNIQTQVVQDVIAIQLLIGDWEATKEPLAKISNAANRIETQLSMLDQMLGQLEEKQEKQKKNTEKKPEDEAVFAGQLKHATALAKQTVEDALKDSKDVSAQSLAALFWGNLLAMSGNKVEAKTAFDLSYEKAKGLESVEKVERLISVLRCQVTYGMIEEAKTLLAAITATEFKDNAVVKDQAIGNIATALAKTGKINDALLILGTMSLPDAKDNALLEIAKDALETSTAEELLKLLPLASEPKRRELLVNLMIQELVGLKRNDIVDALIEHSTQKLQIRIYQKQVAFEALVQEKKFDEAAKIIESFTKEEKETMDAGANQPGSAQVESELSPSAERMQMMKRYIAIIQFQSGDKEKAIALIKTVQSEGEQKLFKQIIQKKMEDAKEKPVAAERFDVIFDVAQVQGQLTDLEGIQQSLALLDEILDKVEKPTEKLICLTRLIDLQSTWGDKEGVKSRVAAIIRLIDETKDVTAFKDLVPQPESALPPLADPQQPILNMQIKPPVDTNAIKSHLGIVFIELASILRGIEEMDGAKKSFARAVETLPSEQDVVLRCRKTILFARFLLELENVKKTP